MRKYKKSETEKMRRFFNTTSKCLIWFFSINAALWIWCSYILAWFGRADIAESLSSNVCTVCIGTMAVYLVTKTIENVFKYNNFGGQGVPYEGYVPVKEETLNESTSFN